MMCSFSNLDLVSVGRVVATRSRYLLFHGREQDLACRSRNPIRRYVHRNLSSSSIQKKFRERERKRKKCQFPVAVAQQPVMVTMSVTIPQGTMPGQVGQQNGFSFNPISRGKINVRLTAIQFSSNGTTYSTVIPQDIQEECVKCTGSFCCTSSRSWLFNQ